MDGIRLYRWGILLLTVLYLGRQFGWSADYSLAGGPFRSLTHWALILSCASALAMLALSYDRSRRDWGTLIGVTAIMNAMVVFLYWRLFLTDPALVNTGTPVWYVEYYLHLLGPALQWIDALFIYRAFRRLMPAIVGLLAVIAGYLAWIEFFVGPSNDFPAGVVTSGMPYPFLNNMEAPDRLVFYATTTVTALVFLLAFRVLAGLVRRAGRPARA